MTDDKRDSNEPSSPPASAASMPSRILGSLRDALNAASRDDRSGAYRVGTEKTDRDTGKAAAAPRADGPPPVPEPANPPLSAAEAVREAKARARDQYDGGEPTTQALRALRAGQAPAKAAPSGDDD